MQLNDNAKNFEKNLIIKLYINFVINVQGIMLIDNFNNVLFNSRLQGIIVFIFLIFNMQINKELKPKAKINVFIPSILGKMTMQANIMIPLYIK